ncbi:MAG: hypothetical protein LBD57_04195 [Endomicrobium sp.]|jgi:hypothetical protein|uniref:hypothetical protein n=1 Tax=Candidatus Endomicrobiellum cubanum TaxID=3242325 RepID=UPI0028342E49|nr:hypothetical protein [Endomicrobium sp.]
MGILDRSIVKYKDKEITSLIKENQSISDLGKNNKIYNFVNVIKFDDLTLPYLTFVGNDASFEITPIHINSGVLEYSTDTINWTQIPSRSTTSTGSVSTIYMRGKMNTNRLYLYYSYDPWKLLNVTEVRIYGNINVLLDYENPPTTVLDSCYFSMFQECTNLIKAPALPATGLGVSCYESTFSGCTSLKEPPVLPATTLTEGCYRSMFSGCTSLKEPPVLPATTLAEGCYTSMFNNCTSLKEPPVLSATTLAEGCYRSMFNNCRNLKEVPILPAIILAEECYAFMFQGCYGLKEPSSLAITTLAIGSCTFMFRYCINIKLYETSTSEHNRPWRLPLTGIINNIPTDAILGMFTNTGGEVTNINLHTTYYY